MQPRPGCSVSGHADHIGGSAESINTGADDNASGCAALLEIAGEADRRSPLDFDYSLSSRNSPLQLFSRSDHYNFVRKDIPVLFFTTGLHTDYHTPGDMIEKIDFEKMELITKTVYDIGYTVANRNNRLVLDNPFSKW